MRSHAIEQLIIVALCLLLAFSILQPIPIAPRSHVGLMSLPTEAPTHAPTEAPTLAPTPPRGVLEVAKTLKAVSDKFTTHSYEMAYERYLPTLRAKGPIKMLEIGLGCGMNYGSGGSILLWRAYFPSVEIHILEYDRPCAEAWYATHNASNIFLHVGDQANVTDLARVGGDYDLIIDDGGHTMTQQIVSLEYLFPRALKAGGVMIIEDLCTSTMGGLYNDMGGKRTNAVLYAAIGDMTESLDQFGKNVANPTLADLITRVDCMPGICVLEKMSEAVRKRLVKKGKKFASS